jgi:hypothetical protein
MEDVGIFYGHLVHFVVFCYILWTFGMVRGSLVYFFPFWYFCTKKNLATRQLRFNAYLLLLGVYMALTMFVRFAYIEAKIAVSEGHS